MFKYSFFLKLIISAFIIFNLTLISFWMFNRHPWQQEVLNHCRDYFCFFTLNQDYSVFAPNPRSVNVHLEAVVTYGDGTSKLWQYPRIERMDMWQRIIKERYRKFGDDNIAWTINTKLLQDLARYIARVNSDGANKAVMVSIVRYFAAIPPPPYGLNAGLPPHFERQTLLTYEVKPEDLE